MDISVFNFFYCFDSLLEAGVVVAHYAVIVFDAIEVTCNHSFNEMTPLIRKPLNVVFGYFLK